LGSGETTLAPTNYPQISQMEEARELGDSFSPLRGIGAAFSNVHAYRRLLLARPSFAPALTESRPDLE
jgi:hypothetical protein